MKTSHIRLLIGPIGSPPTGIMLRMHFHFTFYISHFTFYCPLYIYISRSTVKSFSVILSCSITWPPLNGTSFGIRSTNPTLGPNFLLGCYKLLCITRLYAPPLSSVGLFHFLSVWPPLNTLNWPSGAGSSAMRSVGTWAAWSLQTVHGIFPFCYYYFFFQLLFFSLFF